MSKKNQQDFEFETEIKLRNRIAKEYHKTREDFSSDKEYNDYLEEIEDMVFNYVNGGPKEKEQISKKIENYFVGHKQQVYANNFKREKLIQKLHETIEKEKEDFKQKLNSLREEEQKEKEAKKKKKDQIEARLLSGTLDQSDFAKIVQKEKRKKNYPTKTSSTEELEKIKKLAPPTYVPSGKQPLIALASLAKPMNQNVSNVQNKDLTPEEIYKQKIASGWNDEFEIRRAKEEYFSSLFCF